MTRRYDIGSFQREKIARNLGIYGMELMLERVKGIEPSLCYEFVPSAYWSFSAIFAACSFEI
jgi:hypothetical protein